MSLGRIARRCLAGLQDRMVKLDHVLLTGIEGPEYEHAIVTMRAQGLGLKHFARFRPLLEDIVSAAPLDDPLLIRQGGLIIARVQSPVTARFLYEEALRRFPDEDVESHFRVQFNTYGAATLLLGVGYVEIGEYARAAEALQAGLRRQPGFATLVSELSIALERLGRVDEALALLDDWVGRRDEMDEASLRNVLLSRGQLLLVLERPDEAEPMFVQCLVSDPDDHLAASELGRVASVRRGEPQEERVLTASI